MWLNPTSANKTSIAIGGIIKETKPGRTLVEDDEGKVSVPCSPSQGCPAQSPSPPCSSHGRKFQSPSEALVAGSPHASHHPPDGLGWLGDGSIMEKWEVVRQMENQDN